MTANPDQPWSRRPDSAPSDPAAQAGGAGPQPSGRDDGRRDEGAPRRMTPLSPGAPAEPLIYQTQQRVPGQQGMFRPRRPPQERDDPLPPTEALPAQDAPQYRTRDFSPEGRRTTPSWAPGPHGADGYPSSERLDYQTLGHQEVRAAVERSRASISDAAGDPSSAAGGAGAPTSGGVPLPPVTGAIPISTPDQPLTRRQLRALREAQEREAQQQEGEAAQEPSASAAERPVARPWAPVFYGDQAQSEQAQSEQAQTDAAAVGDATGESSAPADIAPSEVDPQAPATFAVPVQLPPTGETAAAAPTDGPDAPPSGESLDAWMAKVFDKPERSNAGAEPIEAERPPSEPVALVEPPEPSRWTPESDRQAGSASVLDSLFAPPSQPEAPTSAEHPAESDPSDPLRFLDGQPASSDRVDRPAPSAWAAPQPDPHQPADEPAPVADPTAEEIVVEETTESESDPSEVHPVVLQAEPLPAEPIEHAPTPSGEVPTGHWSQQAAAEDDPHAAARDVRGGHGVVTTNALVLPSLPQPELSGPLTNTGEILVTGSIDLPRSLSSTGAHPTQLDESRLDHELDPGDQQVVSVDSQPIRAIKAVSTHTSTRGMMMNTKPRGNRSLTVLIIVTAALAVGVGVVLVVGLLNNAF